MGDKHKYDPTSVKKHVRNEAGQGPEEPAAKRPRGDVEDGNRQQPVPSLFDESDLEG